MGILRSSWSFTSALVSFHKSDVSFALKWFLGRSSGLLRLGKHRSPIPVGKRKLPAKIMEILEISHPFSKVGSSVTFLLRVMALVERWQNELSLNVIPECIPVNWKRKFGNANTNSLTCINCGPVLLSQILRASYLHTSNQCFAIRIDSVLPFWFQDSFRVAKILLFPTSNFHGLSIRLKWRLQPGCSMQCRTRTAPLCGELLFHFSLQKKPIKCLFDLLRFGHHSGL